MPKNQAIPQEIYDFAIIGGGAAGFSAGLYAARYLMKAVIFEGEFGGETATASIIENWPGTKAIDGYDFMVAMKEQVQGLGVDIISEKVSKVERGEKYFQLYSDTKQIFARSVLLAIGAARRKLGLPDEDRLRGKGISYCTTCDAPLYRGKRVAVVGSGDAAVKGVNMLSKFAKEIFIIVRKDAFKAEAVNQRLLQENQKKMPIHLAFQTEVIAVHGQEKLESISLSKPILGKQELEVDGLMVEVGAQPLRELPEQLSVNLDPTGYISTDNMMRTNIPGVTAAGDCTNMFGHFKQDITAASQGAVAATAANEFLQHHPE